MINEVNDMKKVFIIGGGFAGVWSALGAARLARELTIDQKVEITLINKDEYHGLRPRFYEEDLSKTRIHLSKILSPLNIKYIIGEVESIDFLKF
jgi:NADH dehydrogenase